jgi:hypothetical protein
MIALSLSVLVFLQTVDRPLEADPVRDRLLQKSIETFFEGAITPDQLDVQLREFARDFEAKPYKVGRSSFDISTVPEETMSKYVNVVTKIIGPPLQRFLKGGLSATEAAIKVAPFLLVLGGAYGFDPNEKDDPIWHARTEELTRRIGEFAAP